VFDENRNIFDFPSKFLLSLKKIRIETRRMVLEAWERLK